MKNLNEDVKMMDTQRYMALDLEYNQPSGTIKLQHGGLSKAMARYKLQFIGKAHRADIDALNTLRLFFAILNRQRTLKSCATLMKNL